MFSFKELTFVYFVGAISYSLIEVLFRGYTHFSMALTGGVCFLLFYIMNFSLNIGLIGKCFLASFIITSLEFIVGYFVNIVFKRYTARVTKKSYPMIYTSIGTFCGTVLGSLIARRVSPYLKESIWSVWLALIACSLLFAISFSFLQKYVLYKVFYKKINANRQQFD